MAKAKKKKKAPTDIRVAPTPQAMAKGEFHSAGMAYKRVPVIDTMLTRGQITDREHAALRHYRDQACLAERTGVKSCLDNGPRGSDRGPSAAIISAMLETSRIERELGSLLGITRAVAVNDTSLSEWCVGRFGGRERYDGKGNFVAVVPINEKKHMEMARMELRMAARRIVA